MVKNDLYLEILELAKACVLEGYSAGGDAERLSLRACSSAQMHVVGAMALKRVESLAI